MAREPTPAEKAKMAGGRRYDPDKPQPPWHERGDNDKDKEVTAAPPPAPIIEEAPDITVEEVGVEAPPPPPPEPAKGEIRVPTPAERKRMREYAEKVGYKPPPGVLERIIPEPVKEVTPLEPVIPQRVADFVEPEGAKAVEWDAKGNVTVYTLEGVRYYTPSSTMWAKGYKTDIEYRAPGSEAFFDFPYQATTPPPWVAVMGSRGQLAHISRADAEKVDKLSGEQQFYKLIELGVIDPGSKFFPGKEGWQGQDWRYIPPMAITTLAAHQAKYSVALQRLVSELGLPKGAVVLSYDPVTGVVEYEIPAPIVEGEDAFLQLVQDGSIPKDAIYKGYDTDTGEIFYEIPAEAQKVLPVGFIGAPAPGEVRAETLFSQMIELGEVPAGSILKAYDAKTGEFSYELAGEKILPVGFIGAVAPGEVRAETLFSKMIETGEVPKGATLESYDPKTGEFSYELPPEEKPLVGKVGVTFIGDKRIEVGAAPEVEATLNTIGSYLELFGGAREVKKGVSLEEQLAATEEMPVIGMISPDLRESVLRMGNMLSLFATDIKSKPTEPLAYIPEVLYTAGTFLPIIGTALTWRESSNVVRGINLAIDVAVLFPWLKMGFRSAIKAVQRIKDPSKYAVRQLLNAENKAIQGLAQVIRKTYGKEAAQAFIEVNKAQANYAMKLTAMIRAEGMKATRALRKIDDAINIASKQLATANKAKNWALVRRLENTIKTLQNQRAKIDPTAIARARTAGAAQRLEVATREYRDILKRTGIGIDDTLVLTSLDEMPKMLVKNTEVAVRETIARVTTNVRALRKSLNQVEAKIARLQQVKATTDARIKLAYDNYQRVGRPNTPEHRAWVQAVEEGKAIDRKLAMALYEQAMAQSRLDRVAAQSASDIWSSLSAKRAELAKARAQLKLAEATEARGGAPATALRNKVKRLQADVFKLEDNYLKAIKGLETEIRVKVDPVKGYYAEAEGGIFMGRGRVAAPPKPITEPTPTLLQAMKLAGRKAVPTRVGVGATRVPAVHPQLVDAVATTTLTTIRADWKVGEDEFATIAPMVREAITTEIAPLIKTIVTPTEVATMTPEIIQAIEHAMRAAIQVAIQAATLNKTATQIEAQTRVAMAELVKTAIDPAIQAAIQAKTKPIIKTATKIATITPKLITIRYKPDPITGKIRIPFARQISASPARQPIPMGSIAWALGMRKGVRGLLVPNWFFIPPPYDQPKPISLPAPPLGALRIDSVKPYETIQIVGWSRKGVPERVDVDLGWADIAVINGTTIRFKSGGEKTDVGKRMPSLTRGMSVEDSGELLDTFPGEPITMQGITRPRLSKKKPRRKGRRTDWGDGGFGMTSVRGFRR